MCEVIQNKKIKVKIYGEPPVYASSHAAGADLCAYLSQSIVIQPKERMLIPTNIYMSIPEGYEGQIRPRSGLATKFGITLINSPGTIDSDYRGEIKLPIINLGQEAYTISHGDKIAQLVITPIVQADFVPVQKEELSQTVRGEGGFGSTGK